jgi:adenine deaminase
VSIHGELQLLTQAGLTPSEALEAATSAPADAFRLTDRGRIVRGARADLVLVDGNPLADITATRAIVRVFKNGFEIQRAPAEPAVGALKESLQRTLRQIVSLQIRELISAVMS